MNFHIIFRTIAELSFVVKYKISNEKYEDFFLFKGNQSKAHLYRESNVLNLYLCCKGGINHYKYENVSSIFTFSWSDFTINGSKMYAVNQSYEKVYDFTDFKFISPVVELYDHYSFEPIVNSLSEIKSLNYGYFVLIMIIVIITLKSDFRAIANAMKVILNVENDYVSMHNIQMKNTVQDNGKEPG